jgi:hypothetical protein
MICSRGDNSLNSLYDVLSRGDVVNSRTAINGESVEFLGLGSYIIHAVDGDDFFRTVATAFD